MPPFVSGTQMRPSPIASAQRLGRFVVQAALLPVALTAQTVQIRFLDSATGCAIQPERVTTQAHQPGAVEHAVPASQISKAGRSALALGPGRHTVVAVSSGHQPMSAEIDAEANQACVIQFQLDPL